MLAPRLNEVLAQTDPFDLAQAAERYVRTLSGDRIRGLIRDALPRMSTYYADEFSAIATVENEVSLQHAFARALKSNLRAIPLFGRPFGEAVLAQTPSERAVGFGDQRAPTAPRYVAAAVVACALIAAAIGGLRYVSAGRAQASSATATPNIALALPAGSVRIARIGRSGAAPPRPAQSPAAAPPPVQAAVPVQRAFAPAQLPDVRQPLRAARRGRGPARSAGLMPVAQGVGVVAVPAPRRTSGGTPVQAAALDTSDMPQPYTDATPLPTESAAPALAPHAVRVATPTPAPKHHGWLHRTFMHLDPFKPDPHPVSTP